MEFFKDILGYEGCYEISDMGTIRSKPRKTNKQFNNQIIKKQQIDKYGYKRCTLWRGGKKKFKQVHRLVAEAFIPNPNNLPQVNHINGIKTDNRVENLEWCDAFENQSHRFKVLGQVTHNRKLRKEEVFEILSQKGNGWRKHIADKLKVTESCIKAVRSGRNYKEWFDEHMNLSVDDLVSYGWVKLKEDK